MGGGIDSPPKSSVWRGYPKRRCTEIGCKKRARRLIDGKPKCKKHS